MVSKENKSSSGRSTGGQKASEGGRGNPSKASPIAIERAIKGMHFPTDKEGLLQKAKENNAQSDIMNVMNQMEDREYNSVIDIAREIGRVE